MKLRFVILSITLFIFMGSLLSCSKIYKDLTKVTFDKVLDGDTIKVSMNGELKDVKMLLVDAPSLRGSHPFSLESKKFLQSKLSKGDYVYLEYDEENIDEYGKIHAYVWYINSKKNLELINDLILSEGFGRLLDGESKYLDELKASEDNAKKEKKNIWSIDGYVTDTGYKRLNKGE